MRNGKVYIKRSKCRVVMLPWKGLLLELPVITRIANGEI